MHRHARALVALLAVSFAVTGTGLPCLFACAAHAEESHAHAVPGHGDDADHDWPCGDDVLCGADTAPAVLAQADAAAPLIDLGIAIVPAALPLPAAPVSALLRRATALPDRSPPFPAGSVILRI